MEKKSKKSSLPYWIISRKKVLSHVFFETISITIIFHLFYDLIEIKAVLAEEWGFTGSLFFIILYEYYLDYH